jgi:hypothetical protein
VWWTKFGIFYIVFSSRMGEQAEAALRYLSAAGLPASRRRTV